MYEGSDVISKAAKEYVDRSSVVNVSDDLGKCIEEVLCSREAVYAGSYAGGSRSCSESNVVKGSS